MKYLQIIKGMASPAAVVPDEITSLCDERDELDELGRTDQGVTSSTSSNSSPIDVSRDDVSPDASVAMLRYWYGTGALGALPDQISGFTGDLARYRDRLALIEMVRLILHCAPWSLTGEERAEQFVAILTPLIAREGQTQIEETA